MRRKLWPAGLIPVLVLLVTLNAHASPEVLVQCSVLSDDDRASLEARALADLAVKQLEVGVLRVTCSEGTGEVSFRSGAFERASAAALPETGRARVEALLVLVDAVTTAAQNERAPPVVTAPESPELATAPAPPSPTPVPVPVPPSSAPAPPAAPAASPPVPPPMPVAVPVPVPAAAVPAEQATPSVRPWHLGAGVEAELWATEVSGAVGLRLRGGRKLAAPIALGAVVGGDRASSEPEAVSVRVWHAGVEAAACAEAALCVVLGTRLTRLSAEASGDWSPASHAKTMLGGTLRLDYVIDLGRLQLVPGAGVLVYPARRTVTLNGERVLSVPRLTGSGVLELRWPL